MQAAEQHVDFFEVSNLLNFGLNNGETGASGTIGPGGGVITVSNPESPICGTSLRVPAGALNKPVRISIMAGEHGCAFGLGPSLKLLPDGLRFNRAATLTIHLKHTMAQENDFDEALPACYRYDETMDQWTPNSTASTRRFGSAVLCDLHHL